MRRVLVTGGAGFIGAHLVRALLSRGDATSELDNFVTRTAANLALALGLDRAAVGRALADHDGGVVRLTDRCEVVAGDIRDAAALAAACAGVEVVFHQAALRSVPRSMAHPLETNEGDATGTLQVLQQARGGGGRGGGVASSSAGGG